MKCSKKAIRQEFKKKIKQISLQERRKQEQQICQQLCRLDVWKNAKTIALTLPMEHELNLDYVFKKAKECNKQIVVPITRPHHQMVFVKYDEYGLVKQNNFGIREPIFELSEICPKTQIDLVIVPGVSYSKSGDRVGFGGGYYDRFLEDFTKVKLSLAYDFQLYEETIWQREETDITLDMVITWKGVEVS